MFFRGFSKMEIFFQANFFNSNGDHVRSHKNRLQTNKQTKKQTDKQSI